MAGDGVAYSIHNYDYCSWTFCRDVAFYIPIAVFCHFGFITAAATMSQHFISGFVCIVKYWAEKALTKFEFRKRRRITLARYLGYIENKLRSD